MSDCRYCANADLCQYIVAPDDCEDFECDLSGDCNDTDCLDSVVAKIRADIMSLTNGDTPERIWNVDVLKIMDKYKAEGSDTEVKDVADIMQRYQKIQEIYDNWNSDFRVQTHKAMNEIGQVLKRE